jgi:putative hydrolase of the HAD superfamily
MKYRTSARYEYILFDLDETLYPRQAKLMEAIGQRIQLFMVQKAGIPADDVVSKRRYYYQQYGTALRGLMEEYRINPAEYLHFVHDLNPRDFFGASPPLNQMLTEIPLRKVIFTNADASHAERVLNTLQVRAHFERIIDLEAINYKNKPDPLAYRRVLELLDTAGAHCIMVDDTARNLIPAKDLGMTTILVDGDSKTPAIDYAVPTIFHVERVLQELLPLRGVH